MAKKDDTFNRDADALQLTGNEALDALRLSGEMLGMAGVSPAWAHDQIPKLKKEFQEGNPAGVQQLREIEAFVVGKLSESSPPTPQLYRPFEGGTWYEAMTGRVVW
mmetsp:Transcript_47723/g.127655  ORF Transcript_47723/g.127655 Transcript_47723/m.127655 type:complete len:106 (-) Transcript_47723:210-527(-)